MQTAVPTISAVALPSVGPAGSPEDRRGRQQRGDRHPGRRVRGHANQSHDARGDSDEEEGEDRDQQRG